MDSERRRRARRIFERAVEVPAAARIQFLETECGDDEALKTAVERLLRADAEADGFLQEPLARVGRATSFVPPDRIGPYQILEEIGQGGMGVVHRAMRDDEAFHRQVAIKLIAWGRVGEETHRRLRAERQILAALDHPWIAKIFDGGTTEEGVAYLVMELVDGVPLDRYCEQEGLSTQQRIELFRKVCAAVHCSHQNLVVHCDLKPSNILVTADGQPKLLDFGIAKLLREGTSVMAEPITVGHRPLTPEYASPEQVRGEVLSTVSDVYSLGVLLHKLLTGQRPDSPPESLPGLGGDLYDIVLKALGPRSEDRYGSAEQLSEDLGRHLDGFPVLARQGGPRYRVGKFLRRHWLPVAATGASFVVLSLFAFSMATLAGRLDQERTKLQGVVNFFQLFFERAGPWVDRGLDLTLLEAVDQNAQLIEGSLQDQPDLKVVIATVLGDIYLALGEPAAALEWSNRALELHRRLTGEESQVYARGLIQVGAALRDLDRFEESEVKMQTGLRWLRAQANIDPPILVDSLNELVSLFCFQGRYQEADDLSLTALQLAEEQLDTDAIEMMVAIANRGLVLRQLGHTAEAQLMYERSLVLYRQTFGAIHPLVATLLVNLSSIQRDGGELALAQSTLEEANDQNLQMFGRDHSARVLPLVGLARLAIQQQKIDQALTFYREAIRVAMASGASPMYVLRPAVSYGQLLLASDRCGEGERWLRDSLEYCQPEAERRWRYAEVEGLLGECLARRQLPGEARIFLERSHQHLQANSQVSPEVHRRILGRLIAFYSAIGDEPKRQAASMALQSLSL